MTTSRSVPPRDKQPVTQEGRSNSKSRSSDIPFRILLAAMVVLAAGIGFLLAPQAIRDSFWLWLALAVCFVVFWLLMLSTPDDDAEHVPVEIPPSAIPPVVDSVMQVTSATTCGAASIFRGDLKFDSKTAHGVLSRQSSGQFLPFLQKDRHGTSILFVPDPHTNDSRDNPWLHIVLLLLTMITTSAAGSIHQGVNLWTDPGGIWRGVPYSFSLLSILGIHEFGHYIVGRLSGMNVSLPFFIPVPFALGTFGAFIQMRSLAENRKVLFDTSLAGPLSGLFVAMFVFYLGLKIDPEFALHGAGEQTDSLFKAYAGSSILMNMIAHSALGSDVSSNSQLHFNAVTFAGWIGFIVTAFNLMPVGQLDGGHVAQAMFGQRIGRAISTVTLFGLMFLAAFVWPGLWVWVLLSYFLSLGDSPPLDDVTPLSPLRFALGLATLVMLLCIVLPIPR